MTFRPVKRDFTLDKLTDVELSLEDDDLTPR